MGLRIEISGDAPLLRQPCMFYKTEFPSWITLLQKFHEDFGTVKLMRLRVLKPARLHLGVTLNFIRLIPFTNAKENFHLT
jgi:hypothetical protein